MAGYAASDGTGSNSYSAAVAAGNGLSGGGQLSSAHGGKSPATFERARARGSISSLALSMCAPCAVAMAPLIFLFKGCKTALCLGPLGRHMAAVLRSMCMPCGICGFRLLQICGVVTLGVDGILTFKNPCTTISCPDIARDLAQIALAPGCVVPGRSLVALFVNTASLLWFFLYLALDLYDSWEVRRVVRAPR